MLFHWFHDYDMKVTGNSYEFLSICTVTFLCCNNYDNYCAAIYIQNNIIIYFLIFGGI